MMKAREDLDSRIHDQRLESDVHSLAENYWSKYGDRLENPYGSSGSAAAACPSKSFVWSEELRLYFKGLVSDERVRDSNVLVAGAGIAICDPKDNLLFHSKKILEASHGGEMISREEADLEALIEGLNKALAFGFYKIVFLCDDNTIFHYLRNALPPRNAKIAALVNQVALLQKMFPYCRPSLVARDNIKFVYESAREAIFSQINSSEEAGKGKSSKETCVICFEDTDLEQMFTIDVCLHRYCFSCMKQHVEAKLHNGQIAKCPHDGCNSELTIDGCAKFLPPNLVEIMSQCIKESATPVREKVYCPDPKCSALMSKNEVLEYTKTSFIGAEQSAARKCIKCQKFFCISCKVLWHHTMTCNDYRRENPDSHGDEQMLKSLAMKKRWRQCANCNHMIELLEGCYHITCRCTYEFCYTCGAEWNNNKATCTCLIWDEDNMIRDIQLPQEALVQLEQEVHRQQQQQQQLQHEQVMQQLELQQQELQERLQLQQQQLQQLQLQQLRRQQEVQPELHQQQQHQQVQLQLQLGPGLQQQLQHRLQRQHLVLQGLELQQQLLLQHEQLQHLQRRQHVLPQLALRLQRRQLPRQQVLLVQDLRQQQLLQHQLQQLQQLQEQRQHQPQWW